MQTLPARVDYVGLRLFVLRNALFDIWTQIETDPAFAQKSTQFETFLQTQVITDEYLKKMLISSGKDTYCNQRSYLVHVASRSNLMTTFCRLEEVDQLGVDVNLRMFNVISLL